MSAEAIADARMAIHRMECAANGSIDPNQTFFSGCPRLEALFSKDGFPSPHHQLMHFIAGGFAISATTPIGFIANHRLVNLRKPEWIKPYGYSRREYFTGYAGHAAISFGTTMWLIQTIKKKLEYVDGHRHVAADTPEALRLNTPAWMIGGMAGTLGGALESVVRVAGQRKVLGYSHLPMTAHSYLSLAAFSSRWGTTFAVYENMKSTWAHKTDGASIPWWRRWMWATVAAGTGQLVTSAMLDFGTFMGITPKPVPRPIPVKKSASVKGSEPLKQPESKLPLGLEKSEQAPPKAITFKAKDVSSMSQNDIVKQLMRQSIESADKNESKGPRTATQKPAQQAVSNNTTFKVIDAKDMASMSKEDFMKLVMGSPPETSQHHHEGSAGKVHNNAQPERVTPLNNTVTTPPRPERIAPPKNSLPVPQPAQVPFPARFTPRWWRIVGVATLRYAVVIGTALALHDVVYKGLVGRASGKTHDEER